MKIFTFIFFGLFFCNSCQAKQAEKFVPDILGDSDNFAITFTPDGKTFYYNLGKGQGGGFFQCKLSNDKWTNPEQVNWSDGYYTDNDLFVAPNGIEHFFMTKRPLIGEGPLEHQNIWQIENIDGRWGLPSPLAVLHSNQRDGFPSGSSPGV